MKLFFLIQVDEEIEFENFYPKTLKKIEKEFLIKIGNSKEEEEVKEKEEINKIWLISKISIQGYK